MAELLIGTDDGLHVLGGTDARALGGRAVAALAADASSVWAVVDGDRVFSARDGSDWQEVASLGGGRATCLLPTPVGLLVGASEARLFALTEGALEPIESFDEVEGRDAWYTPWGGPPATRSLSQDDAVTLYVNVHVGGIPRSRDGGRTWEPTIDIDADVHEVLAWRPEGRVLAAAARGLGVSDDGGETWRFRTRGLHATYLRAVAVSSETVFVSASEGPRGRRAAVYRGSAYGEEPFERCGGGLPEWFSGNIDTNCLDASPEIVAFGTQEGSVFVSDDDGDSWRAAAQDLGAVRCLLLR
ncbi:MAG: hypothetical protein M3198_20330 [Actinomycetota bacterium]|nr:hypothetical protein [Actinomycetota bacterium]